MRIGTAADVSAVVTAVGVGLTAWQLWLNRRQSRVEFEDGLTAMYRNVVAELPVEVFFEAEVAGEIVHSHRAVFYRYFDLCNEQAFLHEQGRISDPPWEQWRAGIAANMRRPAFRWAWEAKIEPFVGGDFEEFRRVLADLPVRQTTDH